MNGSLLTTGEPKRVGFVSTRFHGTDGVTLEARKWAQVLGGMGHSCFWMAGVLDAPPAARHAVPLAFFGHPDGDEGSAYMAMLHDRIADAGIDVRFIADRVGEARGTNAHGRKVYTLFDVYPHADLVTYPSHYEGFGNAFLEAIYFRKPVVVNTYAVYARDLDPLASRRSRCRNW